MYRQMCARLVLLTALLSSCTSSLSPIVLDLKPYENQAAARRLFARDDPINIDAFPSQQKFHFVPVSVGSPPQQLKLVIGTNTGDTVLPSSSLCATGQCEFGSYNSNLSGNYRYRGESFRIEYADDSVSSGPVGTDTFTIGGKDINNMTLCIANQSTDTEGVLGIGYNTLYATKNKYINLPYLIKQQNYANIVGYSLYYNHSNTTSGGRLVFGAVDTSKFYNTLETLQILSSDAGEFRFTKVKVSGISIFNGATNFTLAGSDLIVMPESSASYLQLPRTVVLTIAAMLNATYNSGTRRYSYRRGTVNDATTINFLFGSTVIRIPLIDMNYYSNSTHIELAMSETTGTVTLGLPFFKNTYTVYDFTHNQLSVAPLRHEPSNNNFTMISAAGAVGIKGYVAPPVDNNPSGDGGLSTGAKAGIGAGVGGAALLGICAAIFFIMRRRKRKAATPAPATTTTTTEPHSPETTYYMPHPRQSYGHHSEYSSDPNKLSPVMYQGNSWKGASVQPVEVYGSEPRSEPRSPMSEGTTVRNSTGSPSEYYSPPGSPDLNQFRRKPVPAQEMAAQTWRGA